MPTYRYRYIPIVTESTKHTFLDYINSVNLAPIDYFAVGVASIAQQQFTSITSRFDWQDYFHKKHFAGKDPLIKAKLFAHRKIIQFAEIDYIDSLGKEIMKQRGLYGIKDGLLFVQNQGQLRYMVMLATGFSKFNHYAFLKKHYNKLDRLKHDLTKIIERDTHQFCLN
jgi:hypothetical protein